MEWPEVNSLPQGSGEGLAEGQLRTIVKTLKELPVVPFYTARISLRDAIKYTILGFLRGIDYGIRWRK